MLLNVLTKMKDLLKFGKTFVSLEYRFSSKYELPYKYKVLYTYTFDDGVECSKLELKLHKMFSKYSYKPLLSFHGETECFKTDIKEKLKYY